MGLLAKQQRSGLFTRRGGVFAAVVVAHALGLVLAVHARTRVEPPPVVAVMQVALLNEIQPVEKPPELPQPKIEVPPPTEIVIPLVNIPVIDMPDSRAIVAVATPAPPPPPAAPVATRSDEPVMLDIDQVDYLQQPDLRYPRA